jgi:hypothetical protein
MIKQMLEYTDIDGQRTTRTVMFNLTQFEVEGEMELEVIQDRFQKFQDEVIGDNPEAPLREMTGPEKREILGMIKTLIRHSYGVREGKRFMKSDEIWAEFEQTGAFSAFLYWLFERPDRANAFMAGIWPQGVDRPEDEPRPDLKVVSDDLDDGKSGVKVLEETPDTTPSIEAPQSDSEEGWIIKDSLWDYNEDELLGMSDDEFEAVKNKFTQGRNVPLPLLQISGRRKSQAGGPTE